MGSRLAAVATVLVGVGVWAAGGAEARSAVPFKILTRSWDYYGCPHVRGLECARTAEEFSALWQRVCIPAPIPEVDFQHDMVVAYIMGTQALGGSHPEVVGVARGGGEMEVEVIDHIACGGFGAPSSPMVFVVVHKWPGEVVLERREQLQPGCK